MRTDVHSMPMWAMEGLLAQVRRPTPRDARMALIRAVARRHGVTVREIMGRRALSHLVAARRAAIVAIYDNFPDSLPQIGRLFGRDHTTILHHVRAAGRAPRKGGQDAR